LRKFRNHDLGEDIDLAWKQGATGSARINWVYLEGMFRICCDSDHLGVSAGCPAASRTGNVVRADEPESIVLGLFFWIILAVFIVAIISRYAL